MVDSTYGIISGGQFPRKVYTAVTTCKAGLSVAWIFVFIICFLCFCCSVSSSFGIMYWQRSSLCESTCRDNAEAALEEITETFNNTTPCNWDNRKNVIHNPNAYRNANQVY